MIDKLYDKVGDKTLDSTEYSYDSKTGELVIPASLVTDDITIEATAISTKKEEVTTNNPDTSDNIIFYIIMAIISLVGISTTIIFRKKIN